MSIRVFSHYCCATVCLLALNTFTMAAANAAPPSATARLAALAPAERANAEISLEFVGPATAADLTAAEKAAALWNAGDYADALAALAVLEADGAPLALGIAWRTPLPPGQTSLSLQWGGDVQIGSDTSIDQTELDFNGDNGDLFALLLDTDAGWSLNRSTDGGQTWSETYYWGATVAIIDADLSIASGYAYVGYAVSSASTEARLRRATLPGGAIDGGYHFKTVYNTSPNIVEDLSVESNADSFDNRMYYGLIASDGSIAFLIDDPTDGTTFADESPGITNASRGLDMHWNHNFDSYFLFISYIADNDDLMLARIASAGGTLPPNWDTTVLTNNIPAGTDRTSVAAREDTVMVVYEDAFTNGTGIAYRVSYDAGNFVNYGTIDEPTVDEGAMSSPDITSRSGTGFAVAYNVESGEPDEVRLTYRPGYSFSNWRTRVMNNFDVSTGSWTSVIGTPDTAWGTREYQHAGTYFTGSRAAYFTRPATICADANCDGVVDTYDIDAFVQALLSESDWATYQTDNNLPLCDFSGANDVDGDGVVDTYDIDAFIAALSGGGCP